MSDPMVDVAQHFAEYWTRVTGSAADPEDFWPCCEVLVAGGLLQGQQQDLAAVALGPFKIAVSKFGVATQDFIEVLVPGVIGSLPAGITAAGAASGVLTSAATCLIKILNEGVIFRNTPDDVLRWSVLIYVKSCNDNGSEPTRIDVATHFRLSHSWSDQQIDGAVAWLLDSGHQSALRSMQSPLIYEIGGRLRSRV